MPLGVSLGDEIHNQGRKVLPEIPSILRGTGHAQGCRKDFLFKGAELLIHMLVITHTYIIYKMMNEIK